MKQKEKLGLLAEVASLYYEHNFTQSQIAKKVFISRSKVSRLLKKARELEIVEIKINYPDERVLQVERAIKKQFGLMDVLILKNRNRSYEEVLEGLGSLAAEYLDEAITENMILGISWGRTIYNTVNALNPNKSVPIEVVQIFGAAATHDPVIDAPELIRTIANVYNGKFRQLHAPLYVEDDYVRNSLINDNSISETLELAKNADIILTGIGALDTSISSVTWNGYIDKSYKELLMKKGAVGFISAHFYDKNGVIIDDIMNRRIIGLELRDLLNIKRVIGVAGGEFKAEAVLGALRGGYINVLITDDITALKILELSIEE